MSVFDIGFGIGSFIKIPYKRLNPLFKEIIIEGCEPSGRNYNYFNKKKLKKGASLKIYNNAFLNTRTEEKFDFIAAIYVFPHFVSDELEETVKKINFMLKINGKFILVVANETYIEEKLKSMKDLFIERNSIEFNGRKYKEILHYSDIPEIGKVIDYNREESFYVDLFKKCDMELIQKKDLNDNGFICTIFIFEKRKDL